MTRVEKSLRMVQMWESFSHATFSYVFSYWQLSVFVYFPTHSQRFLAKLFNALTRWNIHSKNAMFFLCTSNFCRNVNFCVFRIVCKTTQKRSLLWKNRKTCVITTYSFRAIVARGLYSRMYRQLFLNRMTAVASTLEIFDANASTLIVEIMQMNVWNDVCKSRNYKTSLCFCIAVFAHAYYYKKGYSSNCVLRAFHVNSKNVLKTPFIIQIHQIYIHSFSSDSSLF